MSQSEANPVVVVMESWRARSLVVISSTAAWRTLEHVGRHLLEGRSLLGEDERPRAPLEQHHPQMLLQGLDLPAYGGLRDEQLLRSPREAQVARRRLKSLEEGQRGQPVAPIWHSLRSCMP